ncbi:DUF1549 domain-containing protein [Roseimaritima ulvae]|uniref:Planctomycete cytochrome C n=1 Tax=Roseimaritima ulvae TaxID=980254 RepID=A0A5B9QKN8_9BACT|nr:DUF1549 domain-containing protein [Roseimaritima ulvae]QEG39638.1 Planctomycete cytochrome C [Roseimaritima ulvae]
MNQHLTHTVIVAVSFVFAAAAGRAADVDFSHDVVPILRTHCIECHGGKEAKGSFSLNSRVLLVESGHVDLEDPGDSYLLELIESTDTDTQMPPQDRPRLKPAEVDTVRRWIEQQVAWEPGFSFAPPVYEPPLRPRRPELPPAHAGRTNPIDRILDAEVLQRGEEIPAAIDDATFLRRATLDLTGLLPSPETLDAFLQDRSEDKREQVIDALLADKIAYADHWMTFFNDLLRNDYSGTGFITGGRKQVSGWLYQSLLENKPFDQLVQELIAPPTDESRGFIDGIRWRGTVSAGQTVEIQFAQSVAQSFLGINLKCASCHDSFIDRWTLEEAYGLAAVYAPRPLELHRCDKPTGRTAKAAWLFPEIGQVDPAKPPAERLKQLAALMTHRENGRFARTIVNRLWYQLMGRGIVHPLDAMQTEPANADLLDFLGTYLVDHDYDLKQVLRLIATSQAYQSRVQPRDTAGKSAEGYHGPVARRMTAEQFLDAVWQLTGAAPNKFDAPITRTLPRDPSSPTRELHSHWIWNRSDHNAPPQTLVFRKQITLEQPIVSGTAVLTCDNEFTLYVNGRKLDAGTQWTEVKAVDLADAFQQGRNWIVVVATNTTNSPSPAGLFFQAQLTFEEGDETSIIADDSWQTSETIPASLQASKDGGPGPWQSAVIVPALDAWSAAVNPQAIDLLNRPDGVGQPTVRAGLLKNTALMRSLGRPGREQIVSMRPTQLSTLEAIDLANESQLAAAFARGAKRIQAMPFADTEHMVRYIYAFALSRQPTADELATMTAYLGDTPTTEAVQDALWAICMLPEFLLVR